MLSCSRTLGNKIDRKTYDRLFDEALPDIGQDRLKYGAEGLREIMWNMLPKHPVRVWEIDDYVVGLDSYHRRIINGKNYFTFNFPLVGEDQNGSKSWWYEQTDLAVKYYRDEGFDGVFIIYSKDSPVSTGGIKLLSNPEYFDLDTTIDQPMSSYAVGDGHHYPDKWGYLCNIKVKGENRD